jgi:hypothetical protein
LRASVSTIICSAAVGGTGLHLYIVAMYLLIKELMSFE